MTVYPTLADCREEIFPLIRKRMATDEPAPHYAFEREGMEKTKGIIQHMEWPTYDTIYQKAGYLFCSIIGGHPFSNGNKRLAVGLLVFFMASNGFRINHLTLEIVRDGVKKAFPNVRWKEVKTFSQPHEYFFYHLALIVADRQEKGRISFEKEREAVAELLEIIFVHKDSIVYGDAA